MSGFPSVLMCDRWLKGLQGYRPLETTARPAVLIQRGSAVQVVPVTNLNRRYATEYKYNSKGICYCCPNCPACKQDRINANTHRQLVQRSTLKKTI